MTKNEYASARIAEEESDVEAQTNAASTTAAESGEEFPMVNEGGEDEQLIQPPKEIDIPISKKIFTDKQLYSMSLWAIRISVLTDSINNTVSATICCVSTSTPIHFVTLHARICNDGFCRLK